MKANTILDGLASAGSEDQSAWLKLVLQAKETLNKIKVTVSYVQRKYKYSGVGRLTVPSEAFFFFYF